MKMASMTKNPYPYTHILLPTKEVMTEKNAGAVGQIVSQLVRYTQAPDRICVFGRKIADTPPEHLEYHGLAPKTGWLYGQNIGFARYYLKRLNNHQPPDIVEVHSRCHVARLIKTRRPDLKTVLYLHNDPRQMKGAQHARQRLWLYQNLDAIIFVSDYLKSCFMDGLDEGGGTDKLITIPNGVERPYKKQLQKAKRILIAGRMVREKGILEACMACAEYLPDFPEWQLDVVGAQHFRQAPPSAYECEVRAVLGRLGGQAISHGFLPRAELAKLQAKAAISIVPSVWQEPFGLTVLEALSVGSALLTTDRGGIPETATGRAIITRLDRLDYNNATEQKEIIKRLGVHLRDLLSNEGKRRDLQNKAWADYPFTAKNMAKYADKYRQALMI